MFSDSGEADHDQAGEEASRFCASRSKFSYRLPETIQPENGGKAVLNSAPLAEVTSNGPIVPKLEWSVSVMIGTPRRRILASWYADSGRCLNAW